MNDGIARMGEVIFTRPGLPELKALGLGSCIGLCLFDPHLKLGCMVHIVLPKAKTPDTPDVGKYADTAVPYAIKEMLARGAVEYRLRIAIAGGAQLFSYEGSDSKLDVGRRNAETVLQLLSKSKAKLLAQDIGGKSGRTMCLDAATGLVTVKKTGSEAQILANLMS